MGAAWRSCAKSLMAFAVIGLEVDPANEQLRSGLEDAKAAKDRPQAGAGPPGMGGLFGPDFLGKLALNPQTRHLMQQPDFLAMLQDLGRNPSNMSKCAACHVACTLIKFEVHTCHSP